MTFRPTPVQLPDKFQNLSFHDVLQQVSKFPGTILYIIVCIHFDKFTNIFCLETILRSSFHNPNEIVYTLFLQTTYGASIQVLRSFCAPDLLYVQHEIKEQLRIKGNRLPDPIFRE